jgi:iron complex transport system substrate-binding protein
MDWDRYLRRGIFVLVAVIGALLAACGDDDEDAGDELSTATISPAATEAATGTEYPLTLTDMLGQELTIPEAPAAVVALSPTTVEFVYAVGGTSLTRSSSVTYPEEALDAVDIGPSYQPSLELIAAQEPDLIIADSMLQPQLAGDLAALGVPLLYVGVATWEDVAIGLELVGKALDKSAAAEGVIGQLERVNIDLAHQLPALTPKVLILNGTPADFYAAKPESYAGGLAGRLGVENVAEGAPDVGRFPGYTKLSLESIVAAEPDVILAITAGPPGSPTITDSLSGDPSWTGVPAVENGRVTEISAELYLQAPGPRAGQALEELAALLYPETFGP